MRQRSCQTTAFFLPSQTFTNETMQLITMSKYSNAAYGVYVCNAFDFIAGVSLCFAHKVKLSHWLSIRHCQGHWISNSSWCNIHSTRHQFSVKAQHFPFSCMYFFFFLFKAARFPLSALPEGHYKSLKEALQTRRGNATERISHHYTSHRADCPLLDVTGKYRLLSRLQKSSWATKRDPELTWFCYLHKSQQPLKKNGHLEQKKTLGLCNIQREEE